MKRNVLEFEDFIAQVTVTHRCCALQDTQHHPSCQIPQTQTMASLVLLRMIQLKPLGDDPPMNTTGRRECREEEEEEEGTSNAETTNGYDGSGS